MGYVSILLLAIDNLALFTRRVCRHRKFSTYRTGIMRFVFESRRMASEEPPPPRASIPGSCSRSVLRLRKRLT